MSQNQQPSQEGPQDNTQNRYSSLDRPRLQKSSVNATRTPQQHGVERRDAPGIASGSIFKNSTNNVVHPGNPNGSFAAQGTSWHGSFPDPNIYNTPTPSRGPGRSLSSSGSSLQSAGQRPSHFYPTPEAADQLYGNVAGRRYDDSSQYMDPEHDGRMIPNPHGSNQSMFPFGSEDPMTGPYSRSSSPVQGIADAVATGGHRGARVGEETAVVLRQQDQQQEVNTLLGHEEARARRTTDEQPDGQPPAKRKKPVATTASLPEKAGKKFGLLYCLWATEDEIFSGDGKDTEPEPFSAKDLSKREHWVQKGVYDLRASSPSKWTENWGSEDYRRDFMKGMSTVRTDLRGIIQLKPAIFGIHDTKAWSKAGGRATIPEVAALIKNTYFLSEFAGEDTPVGRLARNFRHPALQQILIRVFHGEAAFNSGAPSNKAHNTRARQWAPLKVDYRVIAMVATMTRLVLVQADLDSCAEIQDYYWKTIGAIMKMKKTAGSLALVVKLESDINDALWLSTSEEEEDTEDEEDRLFQAALDAV